jgi:hypothetical protein
VALNSFLLRSGQTSGKPAAASLVVLAAKGALPIVVRKAVVFRPSNMKGQDRSTPAASYTLANPHLAAIPSARTFSEHTVTVTVIVLKTSTTACTLSSSAGAALLLLTLLLLYIWFEGGSVGWLDEAVSDKPVLTCPCH